MPLIDAGLKSPQGLAVDAKREILYVADPDQRKVFGSSPDFEIIQVGQYNVVE